MKPHNPLRKGSKPKYPRALKVRWNLNEIEWPFPDTQAFPGQIYYVKPTDTVRNYLMWIEIYFHLKYLDNCTRNVFSAQILGIGSQQGTERRKWEPGAGGRGCRRKGREISHRLKAVTTDQYYWLPQWLIYHIFWGNFMFLRFNINISRL